MEIKDFNKDYRYERKFRVPDHMRHIIPSIMESLFFDFWEIYEERRVNSIYFDTARYDFALHHVNGYKERKKIRIRYYGNFEKAKNPFLEYKIKNGLLGYKRKFKLKNFDSSFSSKSILDLLIINDLGGKLYNDLVNLSPSVFVTYIRSYYLSLCGNFRITFDRDIAYYSLLGSKLLMPDSQNYIEDKYCLLELKYGSDNDGIASEIANRFNFRITNNSKYINALLSHGIICN